MARPNFVFILADDLGYADLGVTGARDSGLPGGVSPNLDRLAREGLLFTSGYSNSPVCSPTRFALATGRYQYRLRGAAEEPLAGTARGNPVLGLPPAHPTLASLLRDAGYATALIGKWHLGFRPHFGPEKSGYQMFFGPMAGGVDYFSHSSRDGIVDLWENEVQVRREGYLTDLLSERAAAFVRAQGRRPFMLSLHYTAPHWPWETRDDIAESRRINGAIPHTDGGSIATYRRMIHHMDEGIGALMAALRETGADADTLVVFTSDNGGERFSDNWPFIGQKMDLLEGGIRVPLLARWPARIAAGGVTDTPAITMDWVATMLEAAGVAPDPAHPLDGASLVPLFADPTWQPARNLFWRMAYRGQRAMRQGQWKYLRIEDHEYLFDLERDARERANQAARQPERIAAMRAAWDAWAATMPGIPADARVSLVYGEAQMPRPSH
ncbi:MAG: sulfatase-like hydrolase/transferase [Burkholderiales bacterium]|nr:sulfatase-like hydrolase/transferase [Burkholderiales bacterium]